MKKNIIFSTDTSCYYDNDDCKEGYKDFLEANGMKESEMSFDEWVQEDIHAWLEAEYMNLYKECGDILCIAELGLWDGKHPGYKILRGGNVRDILAVPCGDDVEFYCDRYNVKCTDTHHDGTNHYTFREIREGVNIDKLCQKIYDGEEISAQLLNKYTKSLRPYVAKVYGW